MEYFNFSGYSNLGIFGTVNDIKSSSSRSQKSSTAVFGAFDRVETWEVGNGTTNSGDSILPTTTVSFSTITSYGNKFDEGSVRKVDFSDIKQKIKSLIDANQVFNYSSISVINVTNIGDNDIYFVILSNVCDIETTASTNISLDVDSPLFLNEDYYISFDTLLKLITSVFGGLTTILIISIFLSLKIQNRSNRLRLIPAKKACSTQCDNIYLESGVMRRSVSCGELSSSLKVRHVAKFFVESEL